MNNDLFLVGRNRMATDSIRHILEGAGYVVAGLAHTACSTLRWLEHGRAGILMVGSELSDDTGFDLVRSARCRRPEMRHILFVRPAEPEYIKLVLDAGVDGLLSPECVVSDMLECVAQVHRAGRYVYGPLQDALVTRFGKNSPLSVREREVLQLIGQGLTSAEIAARLCMSPFTVNRHRAKMTGKLGLSGPSALTRYAALQRNGTH